MQARLKVLQDNANLKQVKLLPITVIGRAADCQLKIASTQVSRKHCRITVTDQEVLIEDLNSANGTYVNQEKIPPGQPTVIAPGSTLHIGPAAFIVDYTPPLTLETMPTTVIKSSELPFLQGVAAGSPPAIPSATPSKTVEPDQETELAPPKLVPSTGSDALAAELPVPAVGAATVAPMPEFLPPAPAPVVAAEEVFAAMEPPHGAPIVVAVGPVVAEVPQIPIAVPLIASPIPVASATAVPVAAVVMAKPLPAATPPVAAPPMKPSPPVAFDAQETVTLFDSGQDTVSIPAPTPKSAPAAFDFLNAAAAPVAEIPAFDGFNFGVTPPSPTPAAATPPETLAKPAAVKKSLFGLFGKKEKPAAVAEVPTTAPDPVGSTTEPTAAADNPFAFFGEPAPAETPAPASPAPATVPEPVAAPASGSDDPFAFLK